MAIYTLCAGCSHCEEAQTNGHLVRCGCGKEAVEMVADQWGVFGQCRECADDVREVSSYGDGIHQVDICIECDGYTTNNRGDVCPMCKGSGHITTEPICAASWDSVPGVGEFSEDQKTM